jgi:FkbM family methyltransferase
MKNFNSIENSIRKSFFIYIFLRKLAPFICKYIDLEEGFNFSKRIFPINKDFVILDIGSNDGTSIQMFRRYFPKTRIIAVDPIEKPRFKLKNVTLIKSALSDEVGVRNLVTPVINGKQLSQYSSFYKDRMIDQICFDMDLEREKVSTIITEVNFNTVDNLDIQPFFIKIDVEGAELLVLKGAVEIINKMAPVILVEIQNQENYNEIKNFLSKFGYINIEPSRAKETGESESTIIEINDFRLNTNNYVWINPNRQQSWRFN